MTRGTETVLDRILAYKREEVTAASAAIPLSALKIRAARAPAPRDFLAALQQPAVAVIAEVKKASPSRGVLRADFDPIWLAERYAKGGAAAVSVLTDQRHFQGSPRHLLAIRETLPEGPALLRKDFLFSEYQLWESRCYGADAVLLIVAALEQRPLSQLIALARALGMAALVEVHDEAEMERAAEAGAQLIGINNRDLRTFEVDISTTERLRHLAPPGATIVAESGIFTREDILRLQAAGVHAALIGEALVTSVDPAAKLRELLA